MNVRMTGYKYWIDPRAAVTRTQLKHRKINDLGESMRWSLHLSEEELSFLERNNPDFNLDRFVASKDSVPFRVTV